MKNKFNHQALEVYFEDDNGFWEKREFNRIWEEIYYENSKGEIRDNRPCFYELRDIVKETIEDAPEIKDVSNAVKSALIDCLTKAYNAVNENNKKEIIISTQDILLQLLMIAEFYNFNLLETMEDERKDN